MISAEQLRDDEAMDRLVAGAYYFRQISTADWARYIAARVEITGLPWSEKDAAREQMIRKMPFIRELLVQEQRLSGGSSE